MSTERAEIRVNGLSVQVVRKRIKNLHLGVIGKLGWIGRQQAKFADQVRETAREMVGGESHHYLGRRYLMQVVPTDGPSRIVLRGKTRMELHLRANAVPDARAEVLRRWYRDRLIELVPGIVAKWEERLGLRAGEVRIRRMKTKWGSCNPIAKCVWLNLELAKKPVPCIEFVIVHELMHLHERRHNERFIALMDQHLLQWRYYRAILNAAPLGHAEWTY
jgi:predicted metal-dependent hydrolase